MAKKKKQTPPMAMMRPGADPDMDESIAQVRGKKDPDHDEKRMVSRYAGRGKKKSY